MSGTPNIAASVLARLLARAKSRGDDYQLLVTAYALERLLFRLGRSAVRDRFVLKGAMLFRLWNEHPYRATRDLDLLRRGDGSFHAIRVDLEEILATPVPDDGLTFGAADMTFDMIRADTGNVGTRVGLPARCGSARLSLQLDIGVGDAAWPDPVVHPFPTLLDSPAAEVFAYARETVVAEKLDALVVLGDRNSRIKDFFDLHMLATTFAFDRQELTESVRRTFERRRTPIPEALPLGLTPAYWANPSRPAQMRAFARRAGLVISDRTSDEITTVLAAFLRPLLDDLRHGVAKKGTWHAPGPWT